MDKLTAISFMGDRPALWPNKIAEKAMPTDVEERLVEAEGCMFSERERPAMLAEQAVVLARTSPAPNVLERALARAATILRHAGRPDRAFIFCLEAQPLLERVDDRLRASGLILERGLCYVAVGEHDRALELLEQAAERFVKLDADPRLGRCCMAMAQAHLLGGDLHRAIECAERARAVLLAEGASARMRVQLQTVEAYLHLLLGHELAERGLHPQSVLEYKNASLATPDLGEIALDVWSPSSTFALDTAIAVHIANARMDAALSAMKLLVRCVRARNNPVEKGLAWLRLAQLRQMHHRPWRAIACARRAAAQFDRLPFEPNRVTAQSHLSVFLEEVGDHEAAYRAACEASQIEAQQQREAVAIRAELLTLDLEAEQELRKTEQTLAYAQRLSNIGHMVASVNHELNQPLSSLKMLAETTIELLERKEQQNALANVALLGRLSARLVSLASTLAAFPAKTDAERVRVSVQHAVGEAMAMLGSRLAHTSCEIVQVGGDIEVLASEDQLVRVFANLLNNALDAMQGCPLPNICISVRLDSGQAVIQIIDAGPGIPENVRERLFQPFFSTKTAGQGLGLGLALSRDVVREMDGDLCAANGHAGGAVFTLTLPSAAQALT